MTAVLPTVLVLVLGALAVLAGSPLTRAVFRLVDRRAVRSADPRAPGTPSLITAGTVLRGGTWIGGLERLAVYAALVGGWREAIAIVLVVKGLARYPELAATTPGAAERFIIGTFVSVLHACACAGLARWLLTLVPA